MSDGRNEGSRAKLGVFVVSGLVLTVAGILALGWGRIFERTYPVNCYFSESVQGLERGSPVSYRGVAIGRVSDISMAQVRTIHNTAQHEAIIAVRADLFPKALAAFGESVTNEEESRALIEKEVLHGLRVRVAWKDITGQKYLDVDFLDPEEYPPPKLGFEPAKPYLPAAVSPSLQDIQKDLATTLGSLSKIDYQRLGANMQQLLEVLTQRVEQFRADEVSASFRDAAEAVRDLAKSNDIKQVLTRLDAVGQDAQAFVKRADALIAKPELASGIDDLAAAAKALRATAESMEKSIPDAVARVDSVAAEAQRAIAESRLPETAEMVRDGVGEIGSAARSVTAVREDLRIALREISEAGRSIGRLAALLERHPESILKGRGAVGSERDADRDAPRDGKDGVK